MNRVLEIDTENHVAVVEPGVTLDQLDEVTAAHDLIYPVFPGEYSASLGGNVATNAGGMRAVKYGVTRHQVLGLEAVLATGEIIRTGGKFVKATTGYDLTQLIIGSEGTLALVTEATLKLYPRLRHQATVLAPFPTLDQITAAIPRIVDSGVGPLILEYIDMMTLSAVTAYVGLDLGIPEGDPGRRARLPRRDDGEPARGPARRGRRARSPSSSPSSARSTCTCCRPAAAAQLIDAREKAFWVAKANNADDIFDVVVPRASIPEFMAKVSELAASQPVVDRRLRARGRRQRAPLDLPARPRGPLPGDPRAVRDRHGARRRDLRRARHRRGEEALLPRARGPGEGRPHAPDQDRVRPGRDPQPRHDLRPGRPAMNGAQALIRTLVDSGVDVCFANPGTSEMHFVAALDAVPEMRAVLGLFEGVVTGAADGYARMADRPAATLLHLGPGLGNGIANLHNARRAHVPIVNIVGDHATYHHQYDAPLDSDIDALASNVSGWIRTSRTAEDVGDDGADAVAAARRPPGQVATLVLPADVSWLEGADAGRAPPGRRRGTR